MQHMAMTLYCTVRNLIGFYQKIVFPNCLFLQRTGQHLIVQFRSKISSMMKMSNARNSRSDPRFGSRSADSKPKLSSL